MPQTELQGGAVDRISSATNAIRWNSENARWLDPVSLAGLGGAVGNQNPFAQLGGLLAEMIMEHVGPLKKALYLVSFDQGAVQTLAEQWQSQFPEALSQQQDQLALLREQIAEHWQGQGAPQGFTERQVALEYLGEALIEACAEAGALTAKANDLLTQARHQIEEWIGSLIGALQQALSEVKANFSMRVVGHAIEAEFTHYCLSEIVKLTEAIHELLKRVEGALEEVAHAGLGIGNAMGGIGSLIDPSESAMPARKPAVIAASAKRTMPLHHVQA